MCSYVEMPDEKLYELCETYGANALQWRRKFAGLLPEVERRRLYIKKGFTSIFHFAAVLAGMSEEQVVRVLGLEKKFDATPKIKALLVEGKVSFHKLARVASIVTSKNEDFWADQLQQLPKSALETLIRDSRAQAGFTESRNKLLSVPGHGATDQTASPEMLAQLGLSPETVRQLLELKRRGIAPETFISEALKRREVEIIAEKNELAFAEEDLQQRHPRYVPSRIRKILHKEFGTKCSIKTCNKPSQETHHTQRWSLSQNHNPHFLARLCSDHHKIAHSIDVKVTENRLSARAGP